MKVLSSFIHQADGQRAQPPSTQTTQTTQTIPAKENADISVDNASQVKPQSEPPSKPLLTKPSIEPTVVKHPVSNTIKGFAHNLTRNFTKSFTKSLAKSITKNIGNSLRRQQKLPHDTIVGHLQVRPQTPLDLLESQPPYSPLTSEFETLAPRLNYLSPEQCAQVKKAYDFALAAHGDQKRQDNSPYILHPVCTCAILAEMKLDVATLMAALLHDVIEDSDYTHDDLSTEFGEAVATIVSGVTKLDKALLRAVDDKQAENFQKMLLAMAKDFRVLLVKLADRLHNMRTLEYKDPSSQRRIAKETLDIYAPIANRIGLEKIYRELQELSFRYLFPFRYRTLQSQLKKAFVHRGTWLGKMCDDIEHKVKEAGLPVLVESRLKNSYGIYCKMLKSRSKNKVFSKVLDICGLRLIVETREQCYTVLGILHALYKPQPGRFKDFIALPKQNGYQSLHTTLLSQNGTPVEVQIRSRPMHWVAESGVAAHWLYKDQSTAYDFSDLEVRAHQWMNSLLELQQTSANASELLEHVKTDLFLDSVFVFTPKNEIFTLPKGATALDFAYAVHSRIGERARSAIVNNNEAPLNVELKSGDRVEVVTADKPLISVMSLNHTTTAKARSQIRHYLRHTQQKNMRDLGEHWLQQVVIDMGGLQDIYWSPEEIILQLTTTGAYTPEQINNLFVDIALGNISPMTVATVLLKKSPPEHFSLDKLSLTSDSMPLVRYASCCFPIPGDAVVGFMKRGEGISVHRKECSSIETLLIRNERLQQHHPVNVNHINNANAKLSQLKEYKAPDYRLIQVTWDEEVRGAFVSRLVVTVDNVHGALSEVSGVIAEQKCNIVGIQMLPADLLTPLINVDNIDVTVHNREELAILFKRLRRLKKVHGVYRWGQAKSKTSH